MEKSRRRFPWKWLLVLVAVASPVALVGVYLFVDEAPAEDVVSSLPASDKEWPVVKTTTGEVFWPYSPEEEPPEVILGSGPPHPYALEDKGKIKEAFDEAINFVRGSHVDGTKILGDLLQRRREFACGPQGFSGEVLSGAPRSEDVVPSLEALYAIFCQRVREVQAGEVTFYVEEVPRVWSGRSFFLPNQYLRLTADASRAMIRNASKPVKEWESVDLPPCTWEGFGGWFRFLPVRNGVGKRLAHVWVQAARRRLEWTIEERVKRLLIGTWMTIECHRLSKRKFPVSLADLVPEYLKAIPIDPYDGEPLRYSAEKRILYSVGTDFIDSGGSSHSECGRAFRDGFEPTLRFDG